MASRDFDLDEEVVSLVSQTRVLVSQAHLLSRSIDATVEELTEFTEDLRQATKGFEERRHVRLPFKGEDRRA